MIGSGALEMIRLPSWRSLLPGVAWGSAAALAGLMVAYLLAAGLWYVALAMLLAVPALALVLHHPLAAIVIWLVVTPFVSVTDAVSVRQTFWVVHRGMPIAVLLVVVLGWISSVDRRRLPRLGWPEILMGGYVVASSLSIAYSSAEPLATAYVFYERVVVPMCLYLIVRFLQPTEEQIRRALPVVAFVLISQAVMGIIPWIAPGALPSMWLTHVGERTVGTFSDPDVFGITVLVCGLLLLYGGMASGRSQDRRWSTLGFSLAMVMVFVTFSRSNWLAGGLVLAGTLILYRRHVRFVGGFVATALALLLASGVLSTQVDFARERLVSEKSERTALSRLPVAVAAISMFEEKPLTGWGYGNFDVYSRPYQTRVGDLVSPEKPHSSHNLFLSILAEQGIFGVAMFAGPMFLWLIRSVRRASLMLPGERTLVASLWLAIGAYIVVNSFSVMKLPFGLGLWWLALGTIASFVDRAGLRSGTGARRGAA